MQQLPHLMQGAPALSSDLGILVTVVMPAAGAVSLDLLNDSAWYHHEAPSPSTLGTGAIKLSDSPVD